MQIVAAVVPGDSSAPRVGQTQSCQASEEISQRQTQVALSCIISGLGIPKSLVCV